MNGTVRRVEESFSARPDGKAAVSNGGMVATAFPEATEAGVLMLKRGGNAVDAACAAALALGVCEPQASGLGGQSMALVWVDGKLTAIDGSSRAPSLASPSGARGDLLVGYGASTVPSTVATLGHMAERYGLLDWPDLVAPAVRIARRGYRITPLQSRMQATHLDNLAATGSGARYFLKDGREPYEPGDLFVQEDLAHTLAAISESGPGSFYTGDLADRIDSDMRRNGGLLRRGDLAGLPAPAELPPVCGTYGGLRICSMPPPGAGDTMLLAMMVLAELPAPRRRSKDHAAYRYVAEAFRRALLHRARRPTDPAAYRRGWRPDASLARRLAGSIRAGEDRPLPGPGGPADVEETTHLSVVDSEGNAVSLTQSIELVYGSKAAADGLGFLYNNYMSAFETENADHPHYLRPGAVPNSSVCPSIVFDGDEAWLAVGSPGSSRIISAVSLFLSRLIDEGDSLYAAMERPRLHCSPDGRVSLERDPATERLARHLAGRGYEVDVRERRSFYMGAIHAALRCRTRPGFQGVAEVRRDGAAAGP